MLGTSQFNCVGQNHHRRRRRRRRRRHRRCHHDRHRQRAELQTLR